MNFAIFPRGPTEGIVNWLLPLGLAPHRFELGCYLRVILNLLEHAFVLRVVTR
jgi:hypothetical protein